MINNFSYNLFSSLTSLRTNRAEHSASVKQSYDVVQKNNRLLRAYTLTIINTRSDGKQTSNFKLRTSNQN